MPGVRSWARNIGPSKSTTSHSCPLLSLHGDTTVSAPPKPADRARPASKSVKGRKR
jgi:hypothetical protein